MLPPGDGKWQLVNTSCICIGKVLRSLGQEQQHTWQNNGLVISSLWAQIYLKSREKVYVPGSTLQPSLMFASDTRSLPRREAQHWYSTRVQAPALLAIITICLKGLPKDNHCSLFHLFVGFEKSIVSPWDHINNTLFSL